MLLTLLSWSAVVFGDPADGLLGHWKLDDAQGEFAEDASANHNDADIWNATWVKGEFGTALHFDGSGAYVTIPQVDGLAWADEMTREA